MSLWGPGDTPSNSGGVDDAWSTRLPQGWQRFADGSVGPPNKAPSFDWNAPFRTQSGVNSPAPSQLRGVTGGPSLGTPALNNGVPGLPAQGTPGTSLNTTTPELNTGAKGPGFGIGGGGGGGGGGAYTDPATGEPLMLDDPNLPQKSNLLGFNPADLVGKGNPIWRALIAAGGAMQPTPAETGEAPTNMWNQRPSGVGGMPGPAGPAPSQRGMPFPQNNDVSPQRGMPWAGNNAGRPYGVGAPAVNLGHGAPGVVAPHPAVQAAAARAAAAQGAPPTRWGDAPQTNSPFTMVMRPNAPANSGSARGGGGTPLATALDLSGYQPQPWAPPQAAAPRPRAPIRGPLAKNVLKRPAVAPAPYPVTESGSPTPMDIQDRTRVPYPPDTNRPRAAGRFGQVILR